MLVEGWSLRQRERARRSWSGLRSRARGHDNLWRGWLIAKSRVRPDRVVMPPPARNDDLRLLQRGEDLAIEQIVPELGVEALYRAILPRAAALDVSGLCADSRDPCLHGLGHELRTVVGADVARHTAQDEQIREHVDHVDGLQLSADADGQALARELVDHLEQAVFPSIMGAVLDKVVGPDMVGMFRP